MTFHTQVCETNNTGRSPSRTTYPVISMGQHHDNIICLPGEPTGRYVQPPTCKRKDGWCLCTLHMVIYLPL